MEIYFPKGGTKLHSIMNGVKIAQNLGRNITREYCKMDIAAVLSLYPKFKYVHHRLYEKASFAKKMAKPMPTDYRQKSVPCCCEDSPEGATLKAICNHPILSKEQEIFLFQKLNYCKYRANVLRENLTKENLKEFIALHNKVEEIRQFIFKHNGRSLVKVLTLKKQDVFENLSGSTLVMLNSIDAFDWSRGYRLMTYYYNAFFRSFRPFKECISEKLRKIQCEDFDLNLIQGKDQTKEQKIVGDFISYVKSLKRSYPKEIQILERLYLNEETETLEQIGKSFKKTKERIRQMKDETLEKVAMFAQSEVPELFEELTDIVN